MRCLKCGRETEQTFCEICRAEMEKYPVKPGTIVMLPKERPAEKKLPGRKPAVPPETVIRVQQRTIRRLGRGVAALVVLLALMGAVLIRLLDERNNPPVGKNYSTVTKPTEETTEAAATEETGVDTQLADEAAIAPAELEDYLFAQAESAAQQEASAAEAAETEGAESTAAISTGEPAE